jgi:hypothetical protein
MDTNCLSETSLTSHSLNKNVTNRGNHCRWLEWLQWHTHVSSWSAGNQLETHFSATMSSVWVWCKFHQCSGWGNDSPTGRGSHLVMRSPQAPSCLTSGDKMSPYSGLALRQNRSPAGTSITIYSVLCFETLEGVLARHPWQGCNWVDPLLSSCRWIRFPNRTFAYVSKVFDRLCGLVVRVPGC